MREWGGMLQAVEKWKSNGKSFFHLQWMGGIAIFAFALLFQSWLGEEGNISCLRRNVGYLCSCLWWVKMLKACYCRGEVTLVAWYLLVKGCSWKQKDRDAKGCTFPTNTYTSQAYILANSMSNFKRLCLAGLVNRCQLLLNRMLEPKLWGEK